MTFINILNRTRQRRERRKYRYCCVVFVRVHRAPTTINGLWFRRCIQYAVSIKQRIDKKVDHKTLMETGEQCTLRGNIAVNSMQIVVDRWFRWQNWSWRVLPVLRQNGYKKIQIWLISALVPLHSVLIMRTHCVNKLQMWNIDLHSSLPKLMNRPTYHARHTTHHTSPIIHLRTSISCVPLFIRTPL